MTRISPAAMRASRTAKARKVPTVAQVAADFGVDEGTAREILGLVLDMQREREAIRSSFLPIPYASPDEHDEDLPRRRDP